MIADNGLNKVSHGNFKPVFTKMRNNISPILISKGRKRYLTTAPVYMYALGNLIDSENNIVYQLESCGFQVKHHVNFIWILLR